MTGNIAYGTPIYVRLKGGKTKRFLLQPHYKGKLGATLKDIVYVKRVALGQPANPSGRASPDPSREAADAPAKRDSPAASPDAPPGKAPDTQVQSKKGTR